MNEMAQRKHKNGWRAALVAGMIAGAGLLAAPAFAQDAKKADASKAAASDGQDTLIFRNGNTLTGTIVSETDKKVKFKSKVSGIEFETEYDKSEILDLKRSKKAGGKNEATKDTAKGGEKVDPASLIVSGAKKDNKDVDDGRTGPKYYYVKLTGKFGSDITQTPMKQAVDDAYAQGAEVLIFEVDADWSTPDSNSDIQQEGRQVQQSFGIFRAVPINDVFVKYIPSVYGDNRPKVVFYVKSAMGGAAFVPMVSCERYCSPDAKWGGIGNLSWMFGGGSQRVLEKWKAAALQTAQGFANWGCVPEEILRAMARIEYVLSVRYVDGKPQYFEGYPTNPGEELLTDDGTEESEKDNIEQLARFQGNDVLLITAERAEKLQLSKGTVASKEELLDRLDLTLAGRAVDARSERIFKNWVDGLERAKNAIDKLARDYREVRVEGEWEARRAARGRQMRLLDEMVNLFRQYGEGLDPRWCQERGIDLTESGEPDINGYLSIKDRIKIDQQLDKRR